RHGLLRHVPHWRSYGMRHDHCAAVIDAGHSRCVSVVANTPKRHGAIAILNPPLKRTSEIGELEMKSTNVVFCSLILSIVGTGLAHADDMSGMDMKKTKPMSMAKKTEPTEMMTYAGSGVVKSVDKTKGAVTLAHEPIAALNWPAMTMAFKVMDAT